MPERSKTRGTRGLLPMPEAHSLCPIGHRPEGPEGSYFYKNKNLCLCPLVIDQRVINFIKK